ncbi:MAG: hypothetical protein M9953_08390, partial [Thermomicrobiales bacterium]|nr:hypothetical protein [Thermomicrobiales bacterium]
MNSTKIYDLEEARDRFMERVAALVPETLSDLVKKEGMDKYRAHLAAQIEVTMGETSATSGVVEVSAEAYDSYVREWQERWGLIAAQVNRTWSDGSHRLSISEWRNLNKAERAKWWRFDWVTLRASKTLNWFCNETPPPISFVGDAGNRSWSIWDGQVDLEAHSLAYHWEYPPAWNPKVESKSEAASRIGQMVNAALDAIEQEVWCGDPIPDLHFDMLVRYQVMGESQVQIARDLDLDRGWI